MFHTLIKKGANIDKVILELVEKNDLKTLELLFDIVPDKSLEKGLALAKELKVQNIITFLEKELPDRKEIHEALYRYAVNGKKPEILKKRKPTKRQICRSITVIEEDVEVERFGFSFLEKAFIFCQKEAANYLLDHGQSLHGEWVFSFKLRSDQLNVLLETLRDRMTIQEIKTFLKKKRIYPLLIHADNDPVGFDYVKAMRTVENLVDLEDYQDALGSLCRGHKMYESVVKAIKYLHEKGANLNVVDSEGNTLLHGICKSSGRNFEACFDYFKANHFKFDTQNNKGQNLLHIAASNDGVDPESARLKMNYLCQNFPNLMRQQDKDEKTPLDVVKSSFKKYLQPHYASVTRYDAINWNAVFNDAFIRTLSANWRGQETLLLHFLFEDLCQEGFHENKRKLMRELSKIEPFKAHFKALFPSYLSRLANEFFANSKDDKVENLLTCPLSLESIDKQSSNEQSFKLVYLITSNTLFLFEDEPNFQRFSQSRNWGRVPFNPNADLIQLRFEQGRWTKTG